MYKIVFMGSPNNLSIFGESGGTSRFYQLAEWFGLRDLVAEREGQYKQREEVLSSSGRSCPQKMRKNVFYPMPSTIG